MRQISILLVEDRPTDVRLIMEAFKEGKIQNNFSVAQDGVETMAFLRREGKYANAPRPDIVLLDWNIPKKNGKEVLIEIKSDPKLKSIPVIVLTNANNKEYVADAYMHGANCYMAKPMKFEDFIVEVKLLVQFWLSAVELPENEPENT